MTGQKIKAELRRENPEQIIFVPRSEIRAYKARYGDRIEFWEVEEDAFD